MPTGHQITVRIDNQTPFHLQYVSKFEQNGSWADTPENVSPWNKDGKGGRMESSWWPMKGTAGMCQYRISSKAPAPIASAHIVLLVSDPDWSAEGNWVTARVRETESNMDGGTYDELWGQKSSYSQLKLSSGYLQVNSSIGLSNKTEAVITITWGELH